MALDEGWKALWNHLGTAPAPSMLLELTQAYSSPGRHYHTLDHIQDCLAQFASAKGLAINPAAVALAIWFHDAVYDPRSRDNEQKSAEWARAAILSSGLGSELAQTVFRLILATRHDGSVNEPDARLLVDIDLSILGRPERLFWQYNEAIRQEYAWVPAALYRQKRAEVLRGFLARNYIYTLEPFRQRFEAQARLNLERAIAHLDCAEHSSRPTPDRA